VVELAFDRKMSGDGRLRRKIGAIAFDTGEDRGDAGGGSGAPGNIDLSPRVGGFHKVGASVCHTTLRGELTGAQHGVDDACDSGTNWSKASHEAILRIAPFEHQRGVGRSTMQAQLLTAAKRPLITVDLPTPKPGPQQLLIEVRACAVCRTDLHVFDGELRDPKLPLVLGHEIIGIVVENGAEADRFARGDRVGVPWLGWTCGICRYCRNGRENLCDHARFTGYHIDGGFAQLTVADQRYCFAIDPSYGDTEAAPLMCAGLIGYRTLRMAGEAELIGIYGFGAAAHIIAQVIRHQGRRLFAFTRPGDRTAQEFARGLGAEWAGDSTMMPPEPLDAALIFAPVGALVPAALGATRKGGTVVSGGIHMSDIPAFAYRLLWEERILRSVANLTRRDAEEFLALAPQAGVRAQTVAYPLERANDAIEDLRGGRLAGAAVLIP
jgi:alcohol dehydrogenase, propanol-preferring